jgi:hypothetical protein
MSGIQLNLIPDVKAQYLKAERTRKTVIVVSVIVIIASAGLVAIMLSILGTQKLALDSANKKIDKASNELKQTADIEKMLTVQSQLNSLDQLHNNKTVNSRLFGYLAKIVPSQVQISKVDINFEDNSIKISGTSDSLESNNKFVDTLKFTNYQLSGSEDKTPAFSNVVLNTFSRDDKGATFDISMNFDPVLFATSSDGIQLIPKQGVTTREQVPAALFNQSAGAN